MWMVSNTEVGNDASSEKDMSRSGNEINAELDTASNSICYHTDLKSDSLSDSHRKLHNISKQYLQCFFQRAVGSIFQKVRVFSPNLHSAGTKIPVNANGLSLIHI